MKLYDFDSHDHSCAFFFRLLLQHWYREHCTLESRERAKERDSQTTCLMIYFGICVLFMFRTFSSSSLSLSLHFFFFFSLFDFFVYLLFYSFFPSFSPSANVLFFSIIFQLSNQSDINHSNPSIGKYCIHFIFIAHQWMNRTDEGSGWCWWTRERDRKRIEQ